MTHFLQEQLQNFLLYNDPAIQQNVIGTKKVSVEKRLAIYQNAYRSRLIDALVTTYPILNIYLGEEVFAELGREYLDQYPSTFRSIRWFGDRFADYLKNHSRCSEFPIVAELAQFEWLMTLAFDAADAPCLKMDEIALIPPDAWEHMRFEAHPSAILMPMHWNTVAIWQALTDERMPEEPKEMTVPITWILWRNDLLSQFCSLSLDEAWAINAIMTGASFGEICEGVCEWIDEEHAALHTASLLKGWITAGLISKVII